MTVLLSAIYFLKFLYDKSLRHVVPSLPRRNQRYVYRLELKLRLVRIRREACFGRLQPVLVIALRELGLKVGAAGLVAHGRALRNYARQLQHVVQVARKNNRGIGPLRTVAEVDVLETL